jgi:hypothetical protein
LDAWFEPRGRSLRPHLIEKVTIPATMPGAPATDGALEVGEAIARAG